MSENRHHHHHRERLMRGMVLLVSLISPLRSIRAFSVHRVLLFTAFVIPEATFGTRFNPTQFYPLQHFVTNLTSSQHRFSMS